jgi:hypothetical protein
MPPKPKGGIELKQANYMQLGKFMINMKLIDSNELLIKYLSYAPVYKLKRIKVIILKSYYLIYLIQLK